MRTLLAVALSGAGALAAQTVHPAPYARAEAADANALPLGWNSVPYRVQQLHAGLPTGTLRGLAWRIDAGQATDVAAFQAVVELSVSSAATPVSAPNRTFDANHGTDRVTVLPPGLVNFVAAPRGLAPRPFLHNLVFTTPFVRTGTGPLCWDLRVTNRSTGSNFNYDSAVSSTNPAATVIPFGNGCKLFGAPGAMTIDASASMAWTAGNAVFRFSGSRLPVSSIVALSVGGSASNYGALPLPFELPGTTSAPSGTCTVYADSLVQVPVFTTASGTLVTNTNLSIGLHRSMNGASLYGQVFAPDAQANAYGVVSSNAVQLHISAPFTNDQVSRVYVGGALTVTGTAQIGFGAVTRFDYQ